MGRLPKYTGELRAPKALTVKLDKATYEQLHTHIADINSEIDKMRQKQEKDRREMTHEELRKNPKKNYYYVTVQTFIEQLIKKTLK